MNEPNPFLLPDPEDPAAVFDEMIRQHPEPWCWACGRGPSFQDQPPWWHANWVIHRHHVVRQPRRRDRRAVILLCPVCHEQTHGAQFPADQKPPLTLAQQLFLKKQHDLRFFDPAFLSRNHVGQIPEPSPPPGIYTVEYCSRRSAR